MVTGDVLSVAARKVHGDITLQLVSAAAYGLVGLGLVALRVATSH